MMATSSLLRKNAGLSLVELLVGIALIGILLYLAVPVYTRGRVAARQAGCASNLRQIGSALHLYAAERGGELPVTSHTTGNSRRKVNGEWVYNIEKSWIYLLAGYLGNVDAVRICPAEEPERRERIYEIKGTSYLLNDVIFDSEEYRLLQQLPEPSSTQMVFISNRPVSKTWDHAHCGGWNTWAALTEDIAPDRHRPGGRHPERLEGSANYLYADGHVESLPAREMKRLLESGRKPWFPQR